LRIFVTGASGMLGTAFRKLLEADDIHTARYSDLNKVDGVDYLDVRDPEEVARQLSEFTPDVVFHLAAETDVDLCEKDEDHSFSTNTIGTENIVQVCLENRIKLVYISTGAVFNGRKRTPYTEFDTPDPINCYARSKYQGELIIESLLSEHFIIRAGWMIGGGRTDKKFVAKMLDLMGRNDSIRVVDDKIGSPTFTFDFAKGILRIVESNNYGLYHLVNLGVASRLEIAQEIKRIRNFQCEIIPVSSAYFPLPAPRSDSEALENYKLKLSGLNLMPHWKDSLEKYLIELDSP
jgi:dTDP-4-dehydrorhamnose reductase